MIRIKRIYDPPSDTDGYRVLVDRLWPRGISRENAQIDAWLKEIAPGDQLRRWYGHDPTRWLKFREHYLEELSGHSEVASELRQKAKTVTVTLLFAAKDIEHNNAVVLKEFLEHFEKEYDL
ncbi:MAG: hypothetical protein A2X80_13000 [Geobacteraceae bacterium GWB2_52_12]|nr:MAG: hypothetical protein A2X80_13000 [Geobacteraceae bacterium GWB2_52_12]